MTFLPLLFQAASGNALQLLIRGATGYGENPRENVVFFAPSSGICRALIALMYANDFHGKIDVNSDVSEPRNETGYRAGCRSGRFPTLLSCGGGEGGGAEGSGERVMVFHNVNF